MKRFNVNVHFDAAITMHGIIAETEEEAFQIARREAANMNLFAEVMTRKNTGEDVDTAEELTAADIREEEREAVQVHVPWLLDQQTPTEWYYYADGGHLGWTDYEQEDATEWEKQLFTAIDEGTHPQTALFDRYARMYARQMWENFKNGQRTDWETAFREAQQDPRNKRVIVVTNEREEESGDGDRYFMVDCWEPTADIRRNRWNVIRIDCAASPYDTRKASAYTVGTEEQPHCEASPENATRWAHLMINAGRVVDIYATNY